MKNLIIILALFVIPTSAFSQDKQMKKLFNNYKDVSGFSLDTGTSEMDINFGSDNDFTSLLNNVREIYVLKFDDEKGNSQNIKKFKKEFKNLIKKNDYNSMLDITSDDVFRMLIRRNNDNDPTDIIIITEDETDSMFLWATKG